MPDLLRARAHAVMGFLLVSGCASRVAPRDLGPEMPGAYIDFELSREGHIVLPGRVNGTEVNILFDTGCNHVVITPELAEELGMAGGQPASIFGGGGELPSRTFEGVELELGGQVYVDLIAHIADLTPVSEAAGITVSVITGGQLLASTVVELDFGRRRLGLHDPIDCIHEEWSHTDTMRNVAGLWMAEVVWVEDRGPGAFILDTGMGAPLELFSNHPYSWADLLEDGRPTQLGHITTLDGFVAVRGARVKTVQVAGLTFRDVPVRVADRPAYLLELGAVGLIGAGFLRRFRVLLDGPHGFVSFIELQR